MCPKIHHSRCFLLPPPPPLWVLPALPSIGPCLFGYVTDLQRAAGWHGGSQRRQVDVSARLPSFSLSKSLHNWTLHRRPSTRTEKESESSGWKMLMWGVQGVGTKERDPGRQAPSCRDGLLRTNKWLIHPILVPPHPHTLSLSVISFRNHSPFSLLQPLPLSFFLPANKMSTLFFASVQFGSHSIQTWQRCQPIRHLVANIIAKTATLVAIPALDLGLTGATVSPARKFPPLPRICCFLLLLSALLRYSFARSMPLSALALLWLLRP